MIETTQINNANLQDEKICHYRLWKNCGATCTSNQQNGKSLTINNSLDCLKNIEIKDMTFESATKNMT